LFAHSARTLVRRAPAWNCARRTADGADAARRLAVADLDDALAPVYLDCQTQAIDDVSAAYVL
jgi:hypothetical protein